jgi:hypothetical protein
MIKKKGSVESEQLQLFETSAPIEDEPEYINGEPISFEAFCDCLSHWASERAWPRLDFPYYEESFKKPPKCVVIEAGQESWEAFLAGADFQGAMRAWLSAGVWSLDDDE